MIEPPKWTRGPWRVAYLDNNGQRVVKSEHIEIATCWHHCVGAIEEEMEANARLVAAAPDLYAAIAAAVPLWILAIHEAEKRGDQEFVAHLRAAGAEIGAALAKARGEAANG